MEVKLVGKSRKGKNRIVEARASLGESWDGETWVVLEARGAVQFSSIRGMWLHVVPNGVPALERLASKWSRWVLRADDFDFEVSDVTHGFAEANVRQSKEADASTQAYVLADEEGSQGQGL